MCRHVRVANAHEAAGRHRLYLHVRRQLRPRLEHQAARHIFITKVERPSTQNQPGQIIAPRHRRAALVIKKRLHAQVVSGQPQSSLISIPNNQCPISNKLLKALNAPAIKSGGNNVSVILVALKEIPHLIQQLNSVVQAPVPFHRSAPSGYH
jgi:hypothetical protein